MQNPFDRDGPFIPDSIIRFGGPSHQPPITRSRTPLPRTTEPPKRETRTPEPRWVVFSFWLIIFLYLPVFDILCCLPLKPYAFREFALVTIAISGVLVTVVGCMFRYVGIGTSPIRISILVVLTAFFVFITSAIIVTGRAPNAPRTTAVKSDGLPTAVGSATLRPGSVP